jgi:hypothetical protein
VRVPSIVCDSAVGAASETADRVLNNLGLVATVLE